MGPAKSISFDFEVSPQLETARASPPGVPEWLLHEVLAKHQHPGPDDFLKKGCAEISMVYGGVRQMKQLQGFMNCNEDIARR